MGRCFIGVMTGGGADGSEDVVVEYEIGGKV